MGNLGLATSFFNDKNRNLVKVDVCAIKWHPPPTSILFLKEIIKVLESFQNKFFVTRFSKKIVNIYE